MYLPATRYLFCVTEIRSILLLLLATLSATTGCGPKETASNSDAVTVADGLVKIELGKSDDRRLLEFYLGGMAGAESEDPFSAGLVWEEGGIYYISKKKLVSSVPGAAADLDAISQDGEIDWEEFESFVLAHYYDYRQFPQSVVELRDSVGDWEDDGQWFTVPVKGVMSPYHRDVHVKYSSVYAALAGFHESSETLLYPVGTTFIAEHINDNVVVELSVMQKRHDGFWDFFGYGADGKLTAQIHKKPRPLDIPVKCVGCHFGTRLFEPEKSFPAAATNGPDGPRGIYVDELLPGASLVATLDEHRKRSDQVLGLYGTLLLNKLFLMDAAGNLEDEQKQILDRFREIL